MASPPEFQLRGELRGHDEDVRGVAVCPLGILTASRDKTAKLWTEAADGGYSCSHTYVGHTDFVVAVLYVPPGVSEDYPTGAIVTGSRDASVRVWDPASASCAAPLTGHQYQVTALGLLPPGEGQGGGAAIVSASLDKTLRVWRGGKCAAVLSGHEGPVLCLLCLPGGELLSGSGDASVRQWAVAEGEGGGVCVRTIKAHTDTVRGMCVVPGLGFATASHDMSCKVWDSSGTCLSELLGHTAIVYCVAACEGGPAGGVLLASGSEDNTARLWRASGECLQVIEHPGNIWALDFLPPSPSAPSGASGSAGAGGGGDLLTGCSDAVARLWTPAPDRASPAAAAALASLLAERKAAREAAAAGGGEGGAGAGGGGALPPGLKVEEAFALSQPGGKDGENKFVKDGATGDVVAYSWDAKAFQWEKIGVVVEGPQVAARGAGKTKKYHGGREWDFVFDVDVGEGLPPKKLAMDAGDNPYLVAQRFIGEHDLPPYFQEQIVQFITQNTGGAQPAALAPMDVTGGGCDPFTGGGGGEGPRPPAPRPPPPGPQPMDITGGGVDPFTGGGGSRGLPAPKSQFLPATTCLVFDNLPAADALARKVREFSAALPPEQRLSEAELAPGGALEALLAKLPRAAASAAAAKGAAAAPAPAIAPADVALLRRLLAWPPPQLFPALDLARLAVLDAAPGGGAELLAAPGAAGDLNAPNPEPGTLAGALASAFSSPLPANHQLALRLAANAAALPGPLRAWALGGAGAALDRLSGPCLAPGAPKAVRLGGATLLANLAAAAALGQLPPEQAEGLPMQAVSFGLELLSALPPSAVVEEADAAFRCLTALGTLLGAGGRELCQVAKDLDVNDRIHALMAAARGGGAAEGRLLQAGIEVTAVIARATGVRIQGE
ncbi:hypothetical protein HYH03_015357 [Edaphochlamys debaryana]|uniref:Phospholipase A-2-activating protein n=1 Tax=Edaphochlamys debaryana TaxID=47281 RepID=A0A835XKS6_9CHLO|nr:hypothetical protein HYH03_015357 [Edaphochlamys debaryana]|eukprot:KAG2485913.1 hypothetical protein HYH03_015357 [Edaphochlamys debaryana]